MQANKFFLAFQPVSRHFETVANANVVTAWKWNRFYDESIKPPLTSDNSLNAGANYFNTAKILVKFDGSILKQDKVSLTHEQVRNTYIAYEINLWPFNFGKDFADQRFCWVVKLTKNDGDFNKYKYSGYDFGFDASEKNFVIWW